MFNSQELECVVCFHNFSRCGRIPRVLHCKHTFCCQCLQKLSKPQSTILTISCPLCRWITCTPVDLTLSCSLYVNTDIWSQIPEDMEPEREDPLPDSHDATTQPEPKLSHSRKLVTKSVLKKLLLFLKGY